MTQMTDTQSLLILAAAGAEGALIEIATADQGALALARVELLEADMIEIEDDEIYPTAEAMELASEFEVSKVRALAVAR